MTEGEERPAWTLRGLARALAIAGVALGAGAGLGYLVAHEGPPPPGDADAGPPKPRPAGPAERVLLSPLTEGSALGDFEVVEIHAVNEEGRLRVVCSQDRAVIRLDVALAADDGPAPPALGGRYAVFYSIKNATPEQGERLAAELAKVLEANAEVPAPPGMEPYTPRPRELPPI
jgi:hypothetical protein